MKEINLKSKRFILKRISKSDASKKYLSWFKDYQVKEFIENSGTIESIKDLKNNIEKENLKKNVFFFKILSLSKNHIGNVKITNFKSQNFSNIGILIGDKKWRGKRLLKEISDMLSSWLFKKFSIPNLNSGVNSKNYASIQGFLNSGYRIISNKKKNISFNRNYFISKLIIGTANFKKNYGFKKQIKKISIHKLKKTLIKNNLSTFDTANNYGSECEIGKISKKLDTNAITKITIRANQFDKFSIISKIKKSLINCRIKKFDAVLIHNEQIVFNKNFNKVLKILKLIKEKGLTKKIGISIYDVNLLKKFEKKLSNLDVISLPYNIFDRRLENKNIKK